MTKVDAPLVEVTDLEVGFSGGAGNLGIGRRNTVMAVDGINLKIWRGETLGLVGESGCGKSTLGRAILQLVMPTAGSIRFDSRELNVENELSLRKLRQRMQMVFQDPFGSLNPRLSVGETVAEPMLIHGLANAKDWRDKVGELFELVGLDPAMMSRYPHEFSGGQRQRVGIARALAPKPDFIVCDEPVSALDVSIQAQIVNLLEDLREQLNLTYLFISHDLALVRHISDRVAVMYLGRIVEIASKADLYESPLHPYTQALLSAVPIPDRVIEAGRQRNLLAGEVPSPLNPPAGCALHPRCAQAMAVCRTKRPTLQQHTDGHWVACHLFDAKGEGLNNPLSQQIALDRADQ